MKNRHVFYPLLLCLVLLVTFSYAQNSTAYRVAFVTERDVLNVRTGAGVSNDIAWTLPPDATNVFITGAPQWIEGSMWVPIQQNNQTGWVNRYFLTEQVAPKTFCRDAAAFEVVMNLKTAVEQRDSTKLRALIAQGRGLLVRLHRWNTEVQFTPDEVANFFADPTVRNWGVGQGSGDPIDGTVAEILLPKLDRDLLPDDLLSCNKVSGGATTGLLTLPDGYEAVNFYSVYRTAPIDEGNEFDWGTWIVGIEYWDGRPYLSFLVHYVWEI